jgi:hypothetical protein
MSEETKQLEAGPYKIDLENYIENLWDNGKLERHEKTRLASCVNFALLETWRNTLTKAAKLTCPLCHNGYEVYFDKANNYSHLIGEFVELTKPCEANSIWQERNMRRGLK